MKKIFIAIISILIVAFGLFLYFNQNFGNFEVVQLMQFFAIFLAAISTLSLIHSLSQTKKAPFAQISIMNLVWVFLLFFWPGVSINTLLMVFSGLLIAAGLMLIVDYIFAGKKKEYGQTLVQSIVSIAGGVLLMIMPEIWLMVLSGFAVLTGLISFMGIFISGKK
ncbi:hypothetical protein GF376_03555 [Candidatus Peregrinibacteria bacterium]|nr:hypothetical protein [Candidatus Peregrinibacteria bacterium]